MSLLQIWGSNPKENYFRKHFNLNNLPSLAVLRIFVDTGYELFINGRFVAKVDEWSNTRDYEVNALLKQGNNLIAIRGMNHSGHRGLALELAVDGASVLTSDSSWRVNTKECWGWMLPECNDAHWDNVNILDMTYAGMPQWNTLPGDKPNKIVPLFDGCPFFQTEVPKVVNSPFFTAKKDGWGPSSEIINIVGDKYNEFASKPLPRIHKVDTILHCRDCSVGTDQEIEIRSTKRYTGPSFVIDFGQEVVGHLRMRLESESEISIRIFYGETINEAMSEPSRDQLLHKMLVEEYRLRNGVQEFESRMRVGFRFARIEFFDCSDNTLVSGFSLRTSLYQIPFKGYFECNDDDLNKLWIAGHKTLHYCMQEYYLDAVKRDRFLWVGDTRFEALYNYYLFGDTKLFQFCWDKIAECQYPDGAIPSSYGQGMSIIWDYVAWYVIAFYDYYMHTGDRDFLIKHKDVVNKATDFLSSKAGNDGLIDIPENPSSLPWMVVLNKTAGKDSMMNLLYLQCLEVSAKIAELSNDKYLMEKYQLMVNTVSVKVKELLQSSPLSNNKRNWRSSILMTMIILDKFAESQSTEALELLKEKFVPMLSSGADTLYEVIQENSNRYPSVNKYNKDETIHFGSYCHGWTAGASMMLMSEVAGIKPLSPGYKTFKIAPNLCDLKLINTVVPTPYGEIAFHAVVDNDISFTIYVPENTEAIFIYENDKKELSSGKHEVLVKKKTQECSVIDYI